MFKRGMLTAVVLAVPLSVQAKGHLSGEELAGLYKDNIELTQTVVLPKAHRRGSVYKVKFEAGGKLSGDHLNCREMRGPVCERGGKWDEGTWRINKQKNRLCMKWADWFDSKDLCFAVREKGSHYLLFLKGKPKAFLKHEFK